MGPKLSTQLSWLLDLLIVGAFISMCINFVRSFQRELLFKVSGPFQTLVLNLSAT